MTDLISELKSEHALIASMLNKVNSLGIFSKEGQDVLLQAKNGLLAHLSKEDHELYPKMKKEAEKNPELERTLGVFAKDMQDISKTALDFFDKYQSGGSGIEFARDFGRLFSVLNMRIGREERILFPEFEKIQD